mgnify:CR=1 FL=1
MALDSGYSYTTFLKGTCFAPFVTRGSRQRQPQQRVQVVKRLSASFRSVVVGLVHDEHQVGQVRKVPVERVTQQLVHLAHIGALFVELVDIIKSAMPAKALREKQHPAKRVFQAIRIEVNDELGQLERAAEEFCDVLALGGRFAVITFHSLEDRIIKETFARRANPCICPKDFPVCVCGRIADIRKVTGKPIVPTSEETEKNPRARSAKLRVAEKIR